MERLFSRNAADAQRLRGGVGPAGGLDSHPGARSQRRRFFAPLRDLEPQGARVYLGMIHNMASFPARLAAARKHLPEFGLEAYCGFGRMPVSELPQVPADHLEAITIAQKG
jgi:hypothetical protein